MADYNVGSVELSIKSKADEAIKSLDALISKMNEVKGSVSSVVTATESSGSNAITTAKSTTLQTNNLSSAMKKLGISVKDTDSKMNSLFNFSKLYFLINYTKRIGVAIANTVKSAIDFVEISNLFNVSMGTMAAEANRFQNRLAEAFQLSTNEMMKFQAQFNNIIKGLGNIDVRLAYGLSEYLTEMAIDFSSLFNTSIDEAMTKFQSALTGQVRPIRSTSGFDITQNTLQGVLDSIGMSDVAIRNLNQVEKRLVIIIALQKQMQNVGAMGDFAKTIEAPAQQLKILSAQLQETGKWIGNFALKYIAPVLPYINGFVMAIKEVVKTFALLTGYEIPKYTPIDNLLEIGDTASTTVDNLDNVTNAIEKVKNATAGIDELNIITPATPSASTSSPVSVGGADMGIDPRILAAMQEYDGAMDSVRMKATQIRDKIMDWLGFTKIVDEDTGEITWKLRDGYTNLEKIIDGVKLLGKLIAGFVVGKIISKVISNVVTLGKGIYDVYKAGKSVNAIFKGFGVFGGTLKFALVGVAATIAIIIARLIDMYKNSENFRRGLKVTWEILKGLFKGVVEAIDEVFAPVGKLIKNLGLTTETGRTVLGVLTAIGLLFTPAAPFAAAYLIFEGIATGIKLIGYASKDSIDEVNVLDSGISKLTKKKLTPVLDQFDELDRTMKTLDWGNIVITDDIVNDIKGQLSKITSAITDELDADKNDALKNLKPLKYALGDDYVNITSSIEKHYDNMSGKTKDNQSKISDIYKKAADENRTLTKKENDEVLKIKKEMLDTSITYMTDSEAEAKLIQKRLKDNATALSTEQASKIVKDSKKTRDETIKNANEQYKGITTEATKLREAGVISEEEYNQIMTAAKNARDDTVKSARDQHTAIVDEAKKQSGDLINNVDWETGQIKSKWTVFWEDFGKACSDGCNDVKKTFSDSWQDIKDWWKKYVAPMFTKKFWTDLFDKIKSGISQGLDDIKKNVTDTWDKIEDWWDKNVGYLFTKKHWVGVLDGINQAVTETFKNARKSAITIINEMIDKINSKLKITWKDGYIGGKKVIDGGNIALANIPRIPDMYANGGFPTRGDYFIANEQGAEYVGSMNGKTAVANTQQIVAGISLGVSNAQAEQNYILREQNKLLAGILNKSTNFSVDGRSLLKANQNAETQVGKNPIEGVYANAI